MHFTGVVGTSAWAGEYVTRVFSTPTYTSANTLPAGYAYMCICIYVCICMRMHIDAYVRLWYCWHVEALLLGFSICAYVCICMRMCMCVHVCVYSACVYVCTCIYVCLCICMHIHLYTLACGCIYALVKAHFVYLYCPISLLHARVSQVFLNTCIFVLYISLFLRVLGWWVCVCSYTRVHTHKLLGYLMWAQVWGGHLECQKNPDRLKRIIHWDHIGVHSTFVYIYAVLRVVMIWANCFFLLTCLFFWGK